MKKTCRKPLCNDRCSPHDLGLLPGHLRRADDAMQGYVFRIIYYHVPSASVAFLFFAVSLIGSIGYLAFRRSHPERAQTFDAWALAGAEVGVVFCTVVPDHRAAVGTPRLGHLVDLGCAPDHHPGALADLRELPAACAALPPARRCRRWPRCWASSGRSTFPSSTCRTAGGAPSIRPRFSAVSEDSGMRTRPCWPRFGWNMLAWFAWGVLVLYFRYRVEREHQKNAQQEALEALRQKS